MRVYRPRASTIGGSLANALRLAKAREKLRRFEISSGVREEAYALDSDLTFLESGELASDVLEFMPQAAFIASDDQDVPAWEFPAMRETVEEAVLSRPADREVLETASQFAILQRLFRWPSGAGLGDGLGDGLPVYRLVELAEVTAGDVTSAETLRRNVRAGALESALATDLEQVLENEEPTSEWQRSMVEDISTCLELSRDSGGSGGITGDEWREACDLSGWKSVAVRGCAAPDGDMGACDLEGGWTRRSRRQS